MKREMPAVRQTLEAWILDSGTEDDVKRFDRRWRSVRPGVDPLPCPNCFLDGSEHFLAPRDLVDGPFLQFRPWFCKNCSETFLVPIEAS